MNANELTDRVSPELTPDLAQSSAQVADLVNLRRRFAKVRRREGNVS